MPFLFDYTCDDCERPFCERILVMNLALDHEDEMFCLECLTQKEGLDSTHAFYLWITDYIMARDCFASPWGKFNASPCPRIQDKSCFCS